MFLVTAKSGAFWRDAAGAGRAAEPAQARPQGHPAARGRRTGSARGPPGRGRPRPAERLRAEPETRGPNRRPDSSTRDGRASCMRTGRVLGGGAVGPAGPLLGWTRARAPRRGGLAGRRGRCPCEGCSLPGLAFRWCSWSPASSPCTTTW